MPHDSIRSAVYRSFVTCDDPKGVVECKTFRKSKISSQRMEGKHENKKTPKNLNRSFSYKEDKNELFSRGGTEELTQASSFQLMEVSIGAHRLNHVIDSWSKGTSFRGQPNEIAKDLLRGALDLQESLAMLSKLQEASQRVSKLKKKQKEKSDLGKADEVGIGRTSSDRFGNPNYQNPRLAADGSSRDCYDELRDVIRDSLARQNLLPNKSSEKKLHCDRRKGDTCAVDMPSTSSSSLSSAACSHDFASFESSLSSKIIREKPKVPNLIAKLMGLEDIPSKPLQSTAGKKLETDMILNQRKQVFDVDIRKERKPHFVAQKVEKECMTLDKIIHNMQFKGLLKGNQYQTFQSNTSYVEKRISNCAASPPIVLMKPSHPYVEAEDLFTHEFTPVEEALDPEENPRIWKTKGVISSKVEQYPQGALNSNEMHRNFHIKATPVTNISWEKGALASTNVQPKQEDRETKFKEKLTSNKMKSSAPVSSRSHKIDNEKKVDKVQRTSRKKPAETESVQSSNVPKSHEQDKALSMVKQKKSETGSKIVNKNHIIQQKNTLSNPTTKCKKPAVSHHLESDHKKCVRNIKPAKELLPTNIEPILNMDDDDKHIDHWNEADAIMKDTAQALQLLSEENTVDDSETPIEDSCNYSPVLLREDTSMLPMPLKKDTEITERNTYGSNDDLSESNPSEAREAARHIFSENPSFVCHAEEEFANIDTFQPIVLQVFTALHDCGISNPKLLFDYANEVMESSCQRCIPFIHPPLQKLVDDSRFCVSIDHSVEEARKGIKNLCNHSNIGPGRLPTDTVSAVLERDLWSKGLMTGAWDMGWRVSYTVDDVHQIISDVDKLVLDELIQEVLSDF